VPISIRSYRIIRDRKQGWREERGRLSSTDLLLVIAALLGLAGYRITIGIQKLLVNLAKPDLDYDPFLENPQDEVAVVVVEKRK